MRRKNKRGVFFSTDALIALVIILLTIIVVFPLVKTSRQESEVHRDILKVLSSLKIGEIDDSYVEALINDGKINDLNKTVLEQIGDFNAINRTLAKNLSKTILNYLNTSDNIGIWYGDILLASKNSSPIETAKNVEVERMLISGIKGLNETGAATGFSARAYLASAYPKKYFYFGGYVGDGNISVFMNISYIGIIKNIFLEVAANTNFSICINENACSGHLEPAVSEFEPMIFDLSAYSTSFQIGGNVVKFVPKNPAERLYMAGGYFKVTYNNSGYEPLSKYHFPGIEGIINIYDGFYVPGNLDEMELSITFNSSENVYLVIGNKIIFNQSTTSIETITRDNNQMLAILGDYDDYERKTIPLRLGIENISYIPVNHAYIISVSDLSGGISSAKADCDGDGSLEAQGVEAVKCANIKLIDMLLDVDIVQIGLVGTRDIVIPQYSHELSKNQESLNNTIKNWTQGGNLDLCEGIQNATETLNNIAVGSDFKSIVLLGTKFPNSCFSATDVAQVRTNTYNLACDAWTNHGIRIDTVGIIGGGDQDLDNLLRNISECANGTYYNQSADDDMLDLYQNLGADLLEVIYYMQIAGTAGSFSSYLAPESYIKFTYTPDAIPSGLITTTEKQFYNSYYGNFSIPSGIQVIEATAISYSGPRWTDYAEINNIEIYKLSDYGNNYLKLGDPYAIHIPNSLIQEEGAENLVKVTTGVSPTNSSAGSQFNKIIYITKQNASSFTGTGVVSYAKGCIWHIEFEDGSIEEVKIPADYAEAENCYYNSTPSPTGHLCGIPAVARACDDSLHVDADALQLAVFDLLQRLDLDVDGRVDTKFTEQDLQISSSEITGIPYIWSVEAQVRRWS